jgi:hypothetical protein
MKLKPNELVLKAGNGVLLENNMKISVKVVLTTQNRIYLINSGFYDKELNEIKEITYFDRCFFKKDGVHVITKTQEVKFLLKGRNKWEKLFSSLY